MTKTPLQLLYTSGTESRPKGATQCSRNLIAQFDSCIIDGRMSADCRERLAGYKAPKFVALDTALPKNASGKILKRELRERYANLTDGEAAA